MTQILIPSTLYVYYSQLRLSFLTSVASVSTQILVTDKVFGLKVDSEYQMTNSCPQKTDKSLHCATRIIEMR